MIPPTLMQRIRSNLDDWEDTILWMYLDANTGLVTIGCGTVLDGPSDASAIAFYHEKTRTPATAKEVEEAWKKLDMGSAAQRKADNGRKFFPDDYKDDSDLRITDQTASDLRDDDIEDDYVTLKRVYDEFDDFPDDAKVALFDMIFDNGGGRAAADDHHANAIRRFGLMNAAIDRGDWIAASKACHRGSVPPERNAETARMFRDSAVHEETAPWRKQKPMP